MSELPTHGTVVVRRWDARCKDCRARGKDDDSFAYPDSWSTHVGERGGTRSDRCPVCRKLHARDVGSMAVPYIDLDVIGRVADASAPTGPLGGLGPLPTRHELTELVSDLAEYDFGLTDGHMLRLLAELERKQVAVVVAGTGSGKSTFLPYRLLAPPDGARLRLAEHGTIVVTEPRVFATKDVAGFVAGGLHRSLPVGAGCEIGYRVKGDPAFDAGCRLLFVTDGSLINWLGDGSLDRFSVVVIDEAHERSRNIDLILGILRAELPRRPHLRVIIASATIDAGFFVEYFGGPERVAEVCIDAKKEFGYGVPLWPGEEVDLGHEDWQKVYQGEDLRDLTRRFAELRLLSSVEDAPTVNAWKDRMPELLVQQVAAIVTGTDRGDVLAFLPAKQMIEDAVSALEKQLGPGTDVYPLYRGVSERIQTAAREARPPGSRRRVVIATNIAETSLTLEGMTFVVDSGLITQSSWDVAAASKTLLPVPHSQDGVRQRWGRVGRKAPGWVYPLYSREQYESLPAHTPPESVRDDLEGFVLQAAAVGIPNPLDYVWPASFARAGEDEATARYRAGFVAETQRSVGALKARGLLDEDGDVTGEGSELLAFNGSLAHANALAGADELACGVEAATALALMSGQNLSEKILLFKRNAPASRRNSLRRVHAALRSGCIDDLDLALKVYAGWERADDREAWAKAHAVDHKRLQALTDGVRHDMITFLSPGRKGRVNQLVRPQLAPRVRAVFSRAFTDTTFVCVDGSWKPRGDTNEEREYILTSHGFVPAGDLLLALQRYPLSRNVAFLSGLVEVYEWAQEASSWLELAGDVSRRSRDDHGRLTAPGFEAMYALADRWPVGSRHRCTVVVDGDRAYAHDAVLVEAAPADVGGPETTLADDEDDDETVELAAEPAVAADAAGELGQGDEARVADLVSMLASDAVVRHEEAEDQHVDLRDIETADPDVGRADDSATTSAAADHSGAGARVAAPEGLAGRPTPPVEATERPRVAAKPPRLRLATGGSPAAGEFTLRVVGYDGVGQERALLVAADADPAPFAQAVARGYTRSATIAVRVVDRVSGWGDPFLIAVDVDIGLEVALGPLELTLSADDRAVIGAIPLGVELDVDLVKMDAVRRIADATRFPQLLRHLERAPARRDGGATWYPAHVTGEVWSGRVVVALDHQDPERGLLHRFAVHRRMFDRQGLPPEPGLPLLIALAIKRKNQIKARVSKTLPYVPHELMGKIVQFCDQQQEKLAFDAAEPPKLTALGPMPAGLRDRLLGLADTSAWRDTVTALWRASNTLGVERIKPGAAARESIVNRAKEEHHDGEVIDAVVSNVVDFGVFVTFGKDRSGLIHKSAIGDKGLAAHPSQLFSNGMELRPRIEEIKHDDRRGVTFSLSLRDFPLPPGTEAETEADIVARYLGTVVDAVVSNVVDFGMFVTFGDNRTGLIHKTSVGAHGLIGDPSQVFEKGMTLRARIEQVKQDGRRGLSFVLTLRDFPLPPGTEALTNAEIIDRYPVGSIIDAAVQNATAFGVFVQIDPHPQIPAALVHKTAIGAGAFVDPTSLFATGLPVRIRIEAVTQADGKLKISASMPTFSLTSVAGPDMRLPLSAGWKRYLRAAADELEQIAVATACELQIADRELIVRGRDGRPIHEALRKLDDIFRRPLALLQIPPGAMGRVIGKEGRGLHELEERFGVRTSPQNTDAVLGGVRREDIEAAIAHLKQRPQLEAITVSWLPPDGTLPRRQ
jgi:predicted RNA-binding protein with RPS1 domain